MSREVNILENFYLCNIDKKNINFQKFGEVFYCMENLILINRNKQNRITFRSSIKNYINIG